jgi:hypothetical protein
MGNETEYQISSSVNNGILEIILTGELKESNHEEMTNKIGAITKEKEIKKALMDIRELKGRLSTVTSYNRVRNNPSHLYKINFAILDIPENASFESFFETTGSNAGMYFKWFTDIDAARTWLKSK